MSYHFKDLIVTLMPPRGVGAGDCDSTSGGCGGTCDAGSAGTVGSCTSECGAQCGQSDEVLNPLQGLIDPAYMLELRMMLRLAVARSQAQVSKVASLESHMAPQTVKEIDALERHLKGALAELAGARHRLASPKA